METLKGVGSGVFSLWYFGRELGFAQGPGFVPLWFYSWRDEPNTNHGGH